MKFACDSCGKKYVLTDEKLVGKRNVRLRCRACDHVVIIKQEGELVVSPIVGPSVRPPPSLAPDLMPSEFPSDQAVEATTGVGADNGGRSGSDTPGDTSDGLAGFPPVPDTVKGSVGNPAPRTQDGPELLQRREPSAEQSKKRPSTSASADTPGRPERRPMPLPLIGMVLAVVVLAVVLMSNC